MQAIVTLIGAWFFAEGIRSIFNLWKYGDRLLVNLPFIVIFLIVIYMLKMYFTQLKCYSKDNNTNMDNEVNDIADINNIHGIFSKKEKSIFQDGANLVLLVFIMMIVSLFLYALLT